MNGSAVKPATKVRTGDRVEARVQDRHRVLEVVKPIDKRLGASQAAECAVDLTPPSSPRDKPAFPRARGSGRPTKRERRQLDRLRQ